MSDRGASSDAARARKKPKTRVKVVASRYALALQNQNQERRQHHSARSDVAVALESPTRRSPRTNTAAAAGTPSVQRNCNDTARSSATTPSQSTTETDQGTGTLSAAPNDLRARLVAYRASKKLQKPPARSVPSVGKSHVTKPADVPHDLRSTPRPPFPRRVANPTEKTKKRLTKVASTPRQDETIIRRPRSAGASSLNSSSRHSERGGAQATAVRSTQTRATTASAQAGVLSEADELELLQCLYYQLCFGEAKAEDTFRRQEQHAEKQMLAAWNILQAKLRQLQETSLRLDREKQVQLVEVHLKNVTAPVLKLAEQLPGLLATISQVCGSLETALNRLPTSGVTNSSPVELKRHLEALTGELDELLGLLQTTHLGDRVSSAVSFEREMTQLGDKFSAALLQVAHLLEELQVEVDSETSMAIQKIQQQRLASGG